MRRLKGNVVLKGLYYLQSAALILINSSVMLAAPYPHQRELHTLQLCRALRAHSEGQKDKIIHVDVKKWDGRNGNEGKGVKNASVFDLFRLDHACCTYGICTYALCSDLLAQVPYLWMELGLGCWMWCRLCLSFGCHGAISLTQQDPLRLRGYLTAWAVPAVTLSSTLALSLQKNLPFSWQEMWISHSYQLVTLNWRWPLSLQPQHKS